MTRHFQHLALAGCALMVAFGCTGAAVEAEDSPAVLRQALDGGGSTYDAGAPQPWPVPSADGGPYAYDAGYPITRYDGYQNSQPVNITTYDPDTTATDSEGDDPRKSTNAAGASCYTIIEGGQLRQVCPVADHGALWNAQWAGAQGQADRNAARPPGCTCGSNNQGGAPPDKLCCTCVYQHQPLCDGRGTDATCRAAHGDCQWIPGTPGRCISRHQKDCEDWVASPAQNDCQRKKMVRRGEQAGWPNEQPACTRFRYNYEGHGTGCTNLVDRVLVCMGDMPACTSFDIEDTGCSTFDNLSDARAEMERIRNQLGAGTCVTVSANQCTGSNACQNRYIFTLTAGGTCERPANCNGGGYCNVNNEIALCHTGNGITSQVCCNHAWVVGSRSCP